MVATNSNPVQALEVIETTVRQVGEALGMPNFTLSDLIKVYSALGINPQATPTTVTRVSQSKKLHPAAPQAKTKKVKSKDGRSARYKTHSQRAEDIVIPIVPAKSGRQYHWIKQTPVDTLFDGDEHIVFLATSNPMVVRSFVNYLRSRASKLGFGLKMEKLAINRYKVQLVEVRELGFRKAKLSS
jgi:hypothetical protein